MSLAERLPPQISAHVRHIEAVEKDLKALSESSASKEDVSRVRAEMKKIYDGLHIGTCRIFLHCRVLCTRTLIILVPEFLDLRSFVWGMRKSSLLY